MSFNESRFPLTIRPNPRGGPVYRTTVIEVNSGAEQRNIEWSQPKRKWVIDARSWTTAAWEELVAWFHAHAGRAHGFRMRDWSDYQVTHSYGLLETGIGTGGGAYQLYRTYTAGSLSHTRTIKKPESGTLEIKRGGVAQTFGIGAGHVACDYTTGIITYVADDSESIVSHSVGASHQFTTAADMSMLTTTEKVYISGCTVSGGTDVINGIAHTISGKTGAGPYTWTISTTTSGLTISGGTAYAYPQAGEALTWSGNFDCPVRFGQDSMEVEILKETSGSIVIDWAGIEIVEIRV
jgi:uncharacterized protein (TIGR02217 family)